jgi:hypothetical protein
MVRETEPRGRRIQEHRAEIDAVRSSSARMVNLVADATDRFAQMEVIMCQWRHISALLDEKGPFIYAVTRTSMRALDR